MRQRLKHILVLAVVVAAAWRGSDLGAAERHMMQPRVPSDKLEEARALASPLSDSAEAIAQGKALYEGKGGCVNCHGATGGGDGPVASSLDPSPRNFQHHGFWRHRTEGEIFWVIKHGSPQTSMIGFEGTLSDDEIWSIIQYERSFARGHGPRHGMGRHGGMGRMGPPEGMGHRGGITGGMPHGE
jgi:mono/diheme cytochrome c family protein